MDAALSIAAPSIAAPSIAAPAPTVLQNAGAVPAEGDGEGGFAAALTRSLAVTVEPAPAVPIVSPPVAATSAVVPTAPMSETTAAIPAEIPAPMPELAEPPSLSIAGQFSKEESEVEDLDAGPQVGAEVLFAPLLPLAIPVPARPLGPIKPPVALPSDQAPNEGSPTILAGATTPPILPFAPPSEEAPVTTSSGGAKATISQPGNMLPLASPPAPEAEGETATSPPDAPIPPQPAPADFRAIAPERSTPPAGQPAQIGLPTLPPELVGLHARPPAGFVETAAPAALPSPSLVRQVSSVVVALAFAPGGSNGFSLSLEPTELGRVQIHVQREGDGHSVRVSAERPETLALLQRDRHELDRGLAEAGLRVDSTGIDFSLDTPAGGGSGQEPGAGRRGHPGGAAHPPLPEREAPPPRVLRSLLDLNI